MAERTERLVRQRRNGPGAHLGSYFQDSAGVRLQFVPYRGAAAFVQDLVAGQIDLAAPEGTTIVPHLHGGKVKTYAVLTRKRWIAAPDIPTIDEVGGPQLYLQFWHGLWVPKNTPKDVVERLNGAVVEALADAAVGGRLSGSGHEIVLASSNPAGHAFLSRNREMVADHQGGQYQGGVSKPQRMLGLRLQPARDLGPSRGEAFPPHEETQMPARRSRFFDRAIGPLDQTLDCE